MTQTIAAPPALDVPAEPVEPPGTGSSHRLRRALPPVAGIAAGTAAITVSAAQYGNWIVDDAAITFAYARSFATGLGPVVAAGAPPVEGFSNPTWTALLAVGRLLGLFDRGTIFGVPDYVVFPKALAALCCAGMLLACYWAATKVMRRPWLAPLAVGVVLAGIPSFVIWCFSGLENSLFAVLVVTLAALLFRATMDHRLLAAKVAVCAGLLAAAAALTRPDGAIYAGAYPIVLLISLRRPQLRTSIGRILLSVAAFVVPFGGYLCWRYLEFGRLVSNTSVAKSQGMPELTSIGRAGELVIYAGVVAVLVLLLVVGMTVARAPWRAGLVTLLVPLGLAVAAYVIIEPDWMAQFRFATPVWALGALAGTLAFAGAFRPSPVRGRVLLAAGTVIAVVSSVIGLVPQAQNFRKDPTLPMCYVADRIGRTFNEYADIIGAKQASVFEPDLGGSALTSRLHIIDMAGLANATVANFINRGDMTGLRNYVFDDVRPTFIHSRGPWGPGNGLSSDPRIDRDYYAIVEGTQEGEPAGDWVRKDAVPNGAALARLRAYGSATVASIDDNLPKWPLRHCGSLLRPGDTRTNLAR